VLEILRGGKVTAAVGEMILQAICLLITLIAVWLGAFKRFAQEQWRWRSGCRKC
jgi:hypothetical protein